MTSEKQYRRGIIHSHSKYSFDSTISISAYLRVARTHNLDFIILTDHDTTAGSRELRRVAALMMPELEVPIAAEYLTDGGDVIAAFMDDEIHARAFPEFVREAREKKAILILPHPYVGHRAPDELARECDLIEAVNCRTSESKNKRGEALAQSLKKRTVVGTDAHLARSIASGIVEVEVRGSLKSSLLDGEIRWATPTMTRRWEYGASQLVKAWKKHDARLAVRLMRGAAARILGIRRHTVSASRAGLG
ncbi:MAG TPA: PHP domain-containing protein [Candidatus Binataceae bacterium]|nr:PHP domain-containing protein [Candidatus Binataceae bacterium]